MPQTMTEAELIAWSQGYAAGYDSGRCSGYWDGRQDGYAQCDAELVDALAESLSGGATTDYGKAVRIHHNTLDAIDRRRLADLGNVVDLADARAARSRAQELGEPA